MLFTKDMSSISFDDIKLFYDLKLREGLRIDYKVDFPADLAKIVTAFANSSGGLILIGIRANATTNEPEALVGVPLRNGLEERVTSIVISNIKPTVYVEVKVVAFKSNAALADNDKAVIAVRVPESDVAPHIATSNNDIWIRVHNECVHADLSTIEQLIRRRDQGVKARQIENARLTETIERVVPTLAASDRACYCVICVLPALPTKVIGFNKSVDDFLQQKILPVSRGGFSTLTPKQDRIEFRSIRQEDGTVRDFFYFNNKGVFIYIRSVPTVDGRVHLDGLIMPLSKALKAVADIFETFQFNSNMMIRIALYGVQNRFLWLGTAVVDEDYQCQSVTAEIEETHSIDEVRSQELDILKSIYNQMLRFFGASFEERVIVERVTTAMR